MNAPDPIADVATFAERVLGRPAWDHQAQLLASPARYRVLCAGRQSGKSSTLAIASLHTAATRRNMLVLLVSAGEEASKRLLADCAALASGSQLLRGSVLDEHKGALTLSNGSVIRSVPASQRQIRGWPVDLLVLDEAGFVDPEIWRAAEPAIIARPGSRVILSSSPWGGAEHFFRALWTRGMDHPDEQVAAWHWPSSISPLVDRVLLEQIRQREAPDYFEREFLARWTDDQGAYFREDELTAAVADYELLPPERLLPTDGWAWPAGAGIDWGVARDANALVVATMTEAADGRSVFFLPWLEARFRWPWAQFIDRVCEVAGAYWLRTIASESNGVGAYPTDDLQSRLHTRGLDTAVSAVWTDARRKQTGFGMVKGLLQSGRLVLPRHPELLAELRALEFEQTTGGTLRIAVPDRAGHDDLAMALMQAVSCVEPSRLRDQPAGFRARVDPDGLVFTGGGVGVPRCPVAPGPASGWLRFPAGAERGEGW